MKYQILEIKTKKPVGKTYACRKRARRRCDKLDLEYGAINYRIVDIND